MYMCKYILRKLVSAPSKVVCTVVTWALHAPLQPPAPPGIRYRRTLERSGKLKTNFRGCCHTTAKQFRRCSVGATSFWGVGNDNDDECMKEGDKVAGTAKALRWNRVEREIFRPLKPEVARTPWCRLHIVNLVWLEPPRAVRTFHRSFKRLQFFSSVRNPPNSGVCRYIRFLLLFFCLSNRNDWHCLANSVIDRASTVTRSGG